MTGAGGFRQYLDSEAGSMLARVGNIRSFSTEVPMVAAASVGSQALDAMERHMVAVKNDLSRELAAFRSWLRGPEGLRAKPEDAQRRMVGIRIHFNSLVTELDIFDDVLTQRSEHTNGIWIAGLDALARDALALPGYCVSPLVVCHLDKGWGAAMRRARTRLPGGRPSPVAIARVPRERMVGSGIAASLVHEVGHQSDSMLGVVNTLRPILQKRESRPNGLAWRAFSRWIGEIYPDFFSTCKLGPASTLGLMSVVSLPRPFVFRIGSLDEDPHPFPWIRVRISLAFGRVLYPHVCWTMLARIWESLYPLTGLSADKRRFIAQLETELPELVRLLIGLRLPSLRGASLGQVLASRDRHPTQLANLYKELRAAPQRWSRLRPTLALAVIGNARAEGLLNPGLESSLVADLLRAWALSSTHQATMEPRDAAAQKPRRFSTNKMEALSVY